MSASLQGTMQQQPQGPTPEELLQQIVDAAAQQDAAMQAHAQEAQGQAQQAQQAYQGAAQAPQEVPNDFISTLSSNLASVIGGTPSYRENQQTSVAQHKADLLKKRADNLQALRDVYSQKAEEAQKAGDLAEQEKYRTKMHGLDAKFDLVNENAKRAEAARQKELDRQASYNEAKLRASSGGAAGGGGLPEVDVNGIADAIARGEQPPVFTGLYRNAGPVRAALAKKGVNITKMQADWNALTRHYSSLNGTIQLRLRQAAANANGSVDVVSEINDKLTEMPLPRGRVEALNRAGLAVIRNGAFGPEAAATATQLGGQIAALQSELANVYQGGGVPTDEARRMAQHIINERMSPGNLRAAIDLAKRDINIRLNAIGEAGVLSPSNPQGEAGQPQTQANIGPNPLEIAQPTIKLSGKRIKIRKGNQTLDIDQAELKDAIAHGWKRAG